MEVIYLKQALDDLEYWKSSGNVAIQERITALITNIQETPFIGIGKPEALKYGHAGQWSRRINKEHRIIYEVEDGKIFVASLKGHYQ